MLFSPSCLPAWEANKRLSIERSDMKHFNEERRSGLSVSAKISLGFSIVLALHVSIAVLGHYGLSKARRDLETYDALRLQVEKFNEIDRVVGGLQRNVLLFAFTGYQGPEVRAAELQGRLEQLLQGAESVVRGVEQDAIEEMQGHLRAHREIFAAVVVDRANRRRLVNDVLMRYGQDFEQGMNSVAGASATLNVKTAVDAAFRAAQLEAMQFVNAPDSVHVRKAKVNLAKAKKLLTQLESEASGHARQARRATLTAVRGYEEALIQMVQATRGYLHLVNVVLAGESEEFRRLAGEVQAQQTAHVRELATSMAADSRRFQFASNIFSVITILLGILAAWFIGRDVAPPLNAIASTFDGLTSGQQCDTIPALGRRDELGRLAAAAQVFKDKAAETERLLRVAESSQVELNALNQQLASQTELAKTMADEAHLASQAKSEFLARMSHELRTPLNAVIGFSDGMLQRADRHPLNDHQRDRLARISSSGQHLLSLINDVLDIEKVESGRSDTKLSTFEVSTLANEVNGLAEGLMRSKPGVEFLLELPDDIRSLTSDADKVKQILINLVGNAIKFTKQGSVTLRFEQDAEEVRISVQDTGIGIAAGEVDRVFDKFYQVHGASQQSLQGTGLGLALCKAFAHQINGSITAHSALGQGSTFTLTIPRQPPANGSSATASQDAAEDQSRAAELAGLC